MTITISTELETRLREQAEREGRAVEDVAETLLSTALDLERLDREEAAAGIQRGLDASAAGRVRPADAVFADMRARVAQAPL